MRLQVKVPLLATLIMFGLGALSTASLLWYQRHVSLTDFQRTSETVARAIKTSLEETMLIGNRQFVQEALVSIGSSQLVSSASVISSDGSVAGSSRDFASWNDRQRSGHQRGIEGDRVNGVRDNWITIDFSRCNPRT